MSAADPPDPDDPIDAYIEHLHRSGHSEKTIGNNKSALNTQLRPYLEANDLDVGEMTRHECTDLIDRMAADPDLSPKSVKTYAGIIRQLYDYFHARGTFEVNPMRLAMDDHEFDEDGEKTPREISIPEMREFVQQLHHPLALTIVMLLVKTGIRVGELCNIDMRDVHLNDNRVKDLFPQPRPEIRDRPDSIYIERSADMEAGEETNGEIREEGNKRERSTIIPVDDELKKVLVLWMAVRPDSNDPGKPFLNRLSPHRSADIGDRHTSDSVYNLVKKHSKDWGWWDEENPRHMNVDNHYFRHFFTTYMRDRTNDTAFVKYIRGDTGDDAIDDYTHNWGDKVREKYTKHIYKLFP